MAGKRHHQKFEVQGKVSLHEVFVQVRKEMQTGKRQAEVGTAHRVGRWSIVARQRGRARALERVKGHQAPRRPLPGIQGAVRHFPAQ